MNETMNVGKVLADQLERLFDKSVTREVLARAQAGALPEGLWNELENMGIPQALVKEEAGGVGLPWADVESVWRAIGYHAAPLPLGETMIGRWALAAAGLEVPDGLLAVGANIARLDDTGRVFCADHLPWASEAGHIVVAAAVQGQCHIALLSRGDATADTQPTINRIPAARLDAAGAQAIARAPLAALGTLGLLPYVAALRASQMSGCLDRLLALCVEHANTRVQFGKPIAKFQAIRHLVASLAEQGAAARVASRFGCLGLDGGDVELTSAVAKIRAGRSASACTAIAHQVFGAMGVTDEHTLHFCTRSLWQWRDEGQSEHWWAERLGARVIAAGGAALWPNLVA